LASRRFVAVASAVASAAPVSARAEQTAPLAPGPPEHIALVYQAPPECPSDDAFRVEVRSRVAIDWEAQPGELARRVGVTVARRGDRYVATIEFLNPQGDRVTRSVAGTACSDVVNGIALVTALAIQSRVEEALAQSEPELAPSPAEAAPPDAPPPKKAPSDQPPLSPVARASTAPVSPQPAPRTPRSVRVRFGAAAAVSTGVGPDPTIGPALFAALEWHGARLGVTGTAFWSGQVLADDVPVRFSRFAGRLEGCPASWKLGLVSFEPCASFELGALRGEASSGASTAILQNPTGGTSAWVEPGVLARLVTSFDPVVVEFEATTGVPLVQERFGVLANQKKESKFEVPAVVVGGALGLGVRL
jgi:hypothetical protein